MAGTTNLSPFARNVLQTVASIPRGRVTSYGAVAAMAGQPRAARGVGWILHGLGPEADVPWWRVVDRHGGLSTFKLPGGTGPLQKARLEEEGIMVDESCHITDDSVWWQPHKDPQDPP